MPNKKAKVKRFYRLDFSLSCFKDISPYLSDNKKTWHNCHNHLQNLDLA